MKMHCAGHAVEQHRHATQRGLPSSRMREAVHAAEALRVRALLLGVRDRRDAVVAALEHRIGALAADHLASCS